MFSKFHTPCKISDYEPNTRSICLMLIIYKMKKIIINNVKVIVTTVVVYFYFKVSQYRKYMQTNITIHFINKKFTNTYTLAIFFQKKIRFIRRNQIFVIRDNNSIKHFFTSLDQENGIHKYFIWYLLNIYFAVFNIKN